MTSPGEIQINGGVYTAGYENTEPSYAKFNGVLYLPAAATVTITDGRFAAKKDASIICMPYRNAGTKLKVEFGDFSAENANAAFLRTVNDQKNTYTGTEANTVELTGGNYKTGKLAVFAENENYDDFVSAGYYRDKDVVNYLNDSSIVVAEVRNGYAVGKDMVDSIVENMSESEKETITVINGDIDLTGVPAGITVKNEGDGKVTVNETKEVKKGDAPYTVPAKTGGYYYYPSTPGITAELNGTNKSATDYPGGDYGLVFRSTAAFSTFQGVQVDGKTLAKSNYTAEEGSTVVYLKAAYLKTLAAGKHTVTILSTSGNTSMDFTIGGKSSSPQTFDAGVGIYAVTAVLSVTGMAWVGKKRH